MERISNFITERLKLTSKTSLNKITKIDINEYTDAIKKIAKFLFLGSVGNCIRKIDAYNVKKEIPYELIDNATDDELIKYWYESVVIQWNDVIQLFADEIVDKHLFTIEELHAFAIKYTEFSKKHKSSMYRNYIDLYNIEQI